MSKQTEEVFTRYLYDISLQKARGYAALKALLQILAEEDGLTLTQAASRLHRRPSSVQDYLRWLIDVDLLVIREQRYFYRDTVLHYWVAYTSRGIETDGFPNTDALRRLVADLAERFARASTQLGRAKESEVRELLRKLAGRTAPGAYLGQTDPIPVPAFTASNRTGRRTARPRSTRLQKTANAGRSRSSGGRSGSAAVSGCHRQAALCNAACAPHFGSR